MRPRVRNLPSLPLLVVLPGVAAWLAIASAGFCEDAKPIDRKGNQASKRGVGSAAVLHGRVVMLEIFVTDDRSKWTSAARERVDSDMASAAAFLQRQALAYGQKIEFVRGKRRAAHYRGRISLDPHTDPQWTEAILAATAGRSGAELLQQLKQDDHADQVVVCLHVNQPALSYNLAYYDGVRTQYTAERMVCFAEYPDGRPTSAATYAHEILHLFGAGDLYFPYDDSDSRKQDASRWFPSDIMLRVDYDIDRLLVGPFTAYRIGWRPQLDPRWRHLED